MTSSDFSGYVLLMLTVAASFAAGVCVGNSAWNKRKVAMAIFVVAAGIDASFRAALVQCSGTEICLHAARVGLVVAGVFLLFIWVSFSVLKRDMPRRQDVVPIARGSRWLDRC